jgi:Asp-tRNA(Asn)/Glu-tRNA(Gln) amidotransferase A subunit family amidase
MNRAMDRDLTELTALDARGRMMGGEFSAMELCEAYLQRIGTHEPKIGAFAFFDETLARAAAKAVDDYRGTGRSLGQLHGLPVGVKDIIDTADLPTENGTVIDAGRRPGRDAEIVRRLRQAGAIVMGKTVTTELAFLTPAKTRNPHELNHTPGGSSSGSAAAVAAGMVPLAMGSQTYGSVIRPASFCGVVGFKPTFGLISRTGVRPLAPTLDTVGVFARTVADAALIADALAGHDPADPDTSLLPPPRMLEVALTEPPVTPAIAFVKTPVWDEADAATKEAFGELVTILGKSCKEVTLPDVFREWAGAHRALMLAGMARNLEPYYRRAKEKLSTGLRTLIEDGMKVTAVDYLTAVDWREALNNGLEQLFDRYDAILTPSAPGEAPRGLESTGNPIFNGLWTLCGTPAISLPLLQGPNNLPVGVQLIGRRGEDGRLLRTAGWLTSLLENVGRHNGAEEQ